MRTPIGIPTLLLLGICWLLAGPAAVSGAGAEATAPKEAIPNDKCLECHSDKDLTKDLPDGKPLSLFVDEKIRQSSVHATIHCAQCHPDLTGEHPDDARAAKPVNCATCHKEQADIYATSIHGVSRAMGSSGAASCTIATARTTCCRPRTATRRCSS